jgi:hypothetical protein
MAVHILDFIRAVRGRLVWGIEGDYLVVPLKAMGFRNARIPLRQLAETTVIGGIFSGYALRLQRPGDREQRVRLGIFSSKRELGRLKAEVDATLYRREN